MFILFNTIKNKIIPNSFTIIKNYKTLTLRLQLTFILNKIYFAKKNNFSYIQISYYYNIFLFQISTKIILVLKLNYDIYNKHFYLLIIEIEFQIKTHIPFCLNMII